jgi:hypothetical protein
MYWNLTRSVSVQDVSPYSGYAQNRMFLSYISVIHTVIKHGLESN